MAVPAGLGVDNPALLIVGEIESEWRVSDQSRTLVRVAVAPVNSDVTAGMCFLDRAVGVLVPTYLSARLH